MNVKKILLGLLKIGISGAILAYLAWQAQQNSVFADLMNQRKDWGLLSAALAICFAGIVLTMFRWCCLARALGLPMTFRDALRIGFLGYLFNLAPMGLVGGDLIKVVMLARHHPGRRTESVVSVFFDRAVGMYVLLLFASTMILVTGFWQNPGTGVRIACRGVFFLAGAGTLAGIVLMLPDFSRGRLGNLVHRLPYVGRPLSRMIGSVRTYRRRPGVLLASALMTVVVDASFCVVVWLIACGLYDRAPSLATHLVITPIGTLAGILPLPMGPFEGVLDYFYSVPLNGSSGLAAGHGLTVALGFRVVSVLIAAVGLVYYFGSRREVAEVLHEAEEMEVGEADEADIETRSVSEDRAISGLAEASGYDGLR